MKKLLVGTGVLLVFAAMAAVFAPAMLVERAVSAATDGRLLLVNASGTVWSGQAEPAVLLPDGNAVRLPAIRWRVFPSALLTGVLAGEVLPAAAGQGISGRFRLARDHSEWSDLRLVVPASLLALAPPFAKLAPAGLLHAQVDSLRWAPPASAGGGTLLWRDSTLGVPGSQERIDLGSVETQFTAKGPGFEYQLQNEGGMAALKARGQWQPGNVPAISGDVRTRAEMPPAVFDALTRIGLASPAGPVRFWWPPQFLRSR